MSGLARRLNWLSGMNRYTVSLALAVFLFTPNLGCLFDALYEPGGYCAPQEPGPVEGAHSLFVVDSVRFPANPLEASSEMSMDFDGVEPIRKENALGQVLGTVFGSLGTDIDGIVASMIADGRILHLIDVQSVSRDTSASVGASVFLGFDLDEDPSDNFTGTETFGVVDPFAGQTMTGRINDGNIVVALGAMPLQLALPGVEEPFVLNLAAARMEAAFDGDMLVGLIGGVLSEEQVQNEFLPIVHTVIARSVALQCDQGVCEPDSNGAVFLDLFDSDGDGEVSLEEVVDNELVKALTEPDLDLFDESGAMVPGCDDVRESLSFVVRFTAVPAQF